VEINKIYQGDCLELIKDIPDKSIDMILCDLHRHTTCYLL
jgi:site-specific DNA-methyltransferase (adenine-specific)